MRGEADNANVRIPPPLIYLSAFMLGVLTERLLGSPRIGIEPGFQRTIGGALTIFALIVIFSGAGLFMRHRTAIIPHRPASSLVRSGIYRLTRNPMYLGMALLYCGSAFLFDSLPALLFLPIALVIVQTRVIAREEAYLERRFGDQYRAYKAAVRRWL